MEEKQIQYLVERYLNKSLTIDENVAFAKMIANASLHQQVKEAFDRALDGLQMDVKYDDRLTPLLTQILQDDHLRSENGMVKDVKPKRNNWSTVWVRSVAAVLLVSVGVWVWQLVMTDNSFSPWSDHDPQELPADKYRAMLTLHDGRILWLDNGDEDTVVTIGNTTVFRDENGNVTYKVRGERDVVDAFNTIATPNGGYYRVILADGTMVWLNAASSITFPVNFADHERTVKVTGEAYFEVSLIPAEGQAASRRKPFIVSVNGVDVHVLGTRFNVNAHGNQDHVETTLFEGAVMVTKDDQSRHINPGQQATFNPIDKQFVVTEANLARTMAWREGRFEFDGNLQDIMEEISRWYDVDVEFQTQGNGMEHHFIGSISRAESLNKVLDMIELTGDVKFKVVQNNIIVMD